MAHSECHSIKRVFVLGMYYITIRHISSTSFNLTSHHTYGYDFLHLLAFPLSFSFYRVRIPSSLRHVQSNECFAFCQGRFSLPKREWKLWDCVCVCVCAYRTDDKKDENENVDDVVDNGYFSSEKW